MVRFIQKMSLPIRYKTLKKPIHRINLLEVHDVHDLVWKS